MATSAHSRAVKSLNTSSGRQRFVFKTFSQRIGDVDIDVYRSLDQVKSEPSEGSSFFRDCLTEWREMNTAEDFISFYEEMIPLVQTLPLVIFHKETIMSELLSRLHIKARLSVEAILRLIAALSRDLLDDFLPFLPSIAESIVSLLESGADREPEIIEQIFTSWSYIMMYLQKYLVDKLVYVLKVTIKLRYYRKEYVQDFMAEAVSFLFRNASFDQLKQGVWKIMLEVVKKPLDARKYGVSALLRYAMRGASSRLHSKAERVLRLLMSDSVLGLDDKLNQGSNSVVEVLILVFEGLCETIEPKELDLMWRRLYAEITDSIKHKHFMRLIHLLSLLISSVQINDARAVLDYRSMVDVVALLLQTLILPFGITSTEDYLPEIFDKALKLMLCTLDVLHNHDDMSTISGCSLQWAPVFELKSLSLLNFVRKLLVKDLSILNLFRVNILSAMSDLIETSQEEVVYLLHSLCERQSIEEKTFNLLDGLSEERLLKIQNFMRTDIRKWIDEINVSSDSSSGRVHGTDLALLWGTVTCVPFLLDREADSSLLTELIDAIDRLLSVESDNISGVSRTIWQSLIGAALSSYSKLHSARNIRSEETRKFLYLARRHKSSLQVLTAVAEFLDLVYGSAMEADCSSQTYHPELSKEKAVEALTLFADNLHHSEKGLRVAALRILCHFEPLICDISSEDQPVQKKMKTEASQSGHTESQSFNVLQLLLSIETTPLSVSSSRKVTLLISRIHMALSAGKIAEVYVPLLLNAMIGVFYNRFSYHWNPASECLAALVSNHTASVWENFISYFEQILSTFQASTDQLDKLNAISSDKSSDLVGCYNLFVCPASDSTPLTTVLSSLLQSLQRIPAVVDSRSRYIVPLFFKFLGYGSDRPTSVESFNSVLCRGKEWKSILKEWLNLLTLTRNLRSFHQNQFLKNVLENRLLDANDPDVQMKVLDCLLIWGDKFLVPYDQHLKKLISFNSFREELTTWSLSSESKLIEDPHRTYIVPLVIRILMPKVRKLKKHSSRKNASVNYRKAVLAFLAQLDIDELPLFFALLIKPLQIVSVGSDGASDWLWTSSIKSVDSFQASNFLKYFTVDNIATLSWKKRSGFLHVIEDVLGVFDEFRIRPFLKFLMGCVVRILGSCSYTLDAAKSTRSLVESQNSSNLSLPEKDSEIPIQTNLALKQSKELRSLCMKIVSSALNKYEDYDFGDDFWDLFFISVKPLVDSFKQEGSSSEKPSSLFACFVAMSRSQKLVPLLNREKNLVPDIFGILTVSVASESVLRYVLKFIENLLSLSTELDDSDNDVKRILLSNLQTLTDSLHGFFKSESATKRKLVKCPGETERRIFKLLSAYIKDPLPARKFIDILLPFLENGAQNSDVCCEVVQIMQNILPVLGSEITTKILNAISPLFVYVDRDMRLSLCDLLDTLSRVDPSVHSVATLTRDLNATSAIEVGGLDYDTIVNAYEKINADFFYTVHHDQTLVILSHCVFDMSSQELILRHSAYRLLLVFVEFAASLLIDVKDDCKMLHSRTASDGGWTGESVKRIISKFLLRHLGSAMKGEDSVKRDWINLLREMVLKLPNVENLNALKVLCDEDTETDFFNNIVHLQRHRRARALLRMKNVIGSCFMAERIINRVFLPLFFNMLFEVHKGKGEHVRDACIEAITSIAGQMRWDSYFSLLMRCFNEMNLNPDKQKAILRLICSVLDEFHFSVASDLRDNASASGTILSGSSVASQNGDDSAMVTEVQASLQKAVLPKIQKILDSDSDKINVNISLAALKVLKLLPGDIMDSQLSSIVHRISNFLKNRQESLRDEARSALAACLKELGLEYLQFIVRVMRTTLKRGYELHVLGYTLNFILAKFLSTPVRGKLDYCMNDLLSIVENDILGDVAEEKDVEKLASKMKETRKRKSFETLQLIAQNVTFKSHALKVLSPVTSQLQKQLTPKVKTKLESMLSHIAAGFECNTSVDQTDLFVFIFGLIEDGIKKEENKDKNLLISGSDGDHKISGGGKNNVRVKAAKTLSSHYITVFALGMLHKSVKNVDKNDLQVLSMLDPFVPLLGNCLHSRYEDVLSSAFRCIIPLLRMPLPSIESQVDKIKGALFDIAQNSVNANSSLVQSCLKLLTVLLGGTKVTLSSEELHQLIQLPIFVDLERNPSFVALSLLKAIINRKLVVPEIYDIVTRVAEMMVTSHEGKIRKKCSRILLRFLLDYRLSGKRLQQHLDFLLSNLRYEHPSGRKAVLEMLHTIIIKFPKTILDDQSQTLFMHLVVCLANDQDNEVRSMTGAAIKYLIRYISASSVHHILESSISWYLDSQSQLWSAAAQVLGLLVEAMKKGFQRHIGRVLPRARTIFLSAIKDVTDRSLDYSDEAAIPLWKEAYYSLIMLEKIMHECGDLCFEQDLEDVWEAICELLLHPHVWLRNVSSRLVALYFSALQEASRENQESPFPRYSLQRPSRLFMIAASLCCQLKTKVIDNAASSLIVHNLVFTLRGVHSLMGQLEHGEPQKFWSNLEQNEQGYFLKAITMLDSGNGRRMFLSLTSGELEKKDDGRPNDIRHFLVSKLLKRMGKTALQMEDVQMKIVLNCFSEFCSQIAEEDRLLYAYEILLPLYKVCEGFAGRVISDDMKQLAQEVSERLRKMLGIQSFVQVYSEIRKSIKAKRDKRRQEEKIMAVVNPMRNAKRKLRIAAKHRDHKKRKIMTMKFGRWM